MARPAVDRFLTSQVWLDRVADPIQRFVGATFKALGPLGRPLKDLLHGTRLLRHPLHPALTDVPLGAWLTGAVADYVAIATDILPREAGTIALAVGLAGALGAVVTGYTDFHETYGLERRTAMAHGLVMTVVFVLGAVSLVFRLTGIEGLHVSAVALATIGLVVTVLGMYLGGHVVYGFGTVINRGAFVEGPGDYVVVGVPGDFPEGEMRRVQANGMPVLVVRHRSALHAISSVCSHAGGPLDQGTLEEDVVICPWHGSRFSLGDGSIRGGPATFPQPELQARERDGKVEVKLAEPPN